GVARPCGQAQTQPEKQDRCQGCYCRDSLSTGIILVVRHLVLLSYRFPSGPCARQIKATRDDRLDRPGSEQVLGRPAVSLGELPGQSSRIERPWAGPTEYERFGGKPGSFTPPFLRLPHWGVYTRLSATTSGKDRNSAHPGK